MNRWCSLSTAMLTALFMTSMGGCAVTRPAKPVMQTANPFVKGGTIPPPEYGSTFTTGNYRSRESDARPGVHFFHYAWLALQKGDVHHAISMYQVSASWAFKPAAYMLALIYFRGEGVPVDRPLGTAWMRLASERDTPLFVKARDAMNQLLTQQQRLRADALWKSLSKTYADTHALKKAKSRWIAVWHAQTGTRAGCGSMGLVKTSFPSAGGSLTGGMGQSQLASVNKSTACDNIDPYSPTFLRNPDNPMFQTAIGIVTVGPLQKADEKDVPSQTKQPKSSSSVHSDRDRQSNERKSH